MFSLFPSYAYKLLSEWKNWMTCLNCVRTTQIHKSSLSFILVLVVMDKRIYQKLNYSCLMIRLMLEMKSNFLLYHVTLSYLVCCVHNIFCKKKIIFMNYHEFIFEIDLTGMSCYVLWREICFLFCFTHGILSFIILLYT